MSSSVYRYWKDRLEDCCPFYNRNYLKDEAYAIYDTLQRNTWPNHVSQRALYADYCEWFSATILAPISLGSYQDQEFPDAAHSRDFNAMMRPFLYVGNWSRTWNRRVEVPRNYQGTWFKEQKFQRFYKLSKWEDHAAAYTKMTGGTIDLSNSKNLVLTKDQKREIVPLLGHS